MYIDVLFGQSPFIASEDAWRKGVSVCIREIANCASSHLAVVACESGKNVRSSHAKKKVMYVYTVVCVELT